MSADIGSENEWQFAGVISDVRWKRITIEPCDDIEMDPIFPLTTLEPSKTPFVPLKGEMSMAVLRTTGLYCFEGRISRSNRSGGSIVMTVPDEISNVQRRQSYRLPLSIQTRLKVTHEGIEKKSMTWIENLSATGALIYSKDALPTSGYVSIDIPMGKEGIASELTALVIENFEQNNRNYARIVFDDNENLFLKDSTRERIIQYIFEEQRVMLTMRKLMRNPVVPPTKRSSVLETLANWLRAPAFGVKRYNSREN